MTRFIKTWMKTNGMNDQPMACPIDEFPDPSTIEPILSASDIQFLMQSSLPRHFCSHSCNLKSNLVTFFMITDHYH